MLQWEAMLSDYQITQAQETGSLLIHPGQTMEDLMIGLYELGISRHHAKFAEGCLLWIDEDDVDEC